MSTIIEDHSILGVQYHLWFHYIKLKSGVYILGKDYRDDIQVNSICLSNSEKTEESSNF